MRVAALGGDPSGLPPAALMLIHEATLRREFHLTTQDLRTLPRRKATGLLAYLAGVQDAERKKAEEAARNAQNKS